MIVSLGNAPRDVGDHPRRRQRVLAAARLRPDVEQADELALELGEDVPQPLVVERISLEQRVDLDPGQAVASQIVDVLARRPTGMDRPEADETVGVETAHERVRRLQPLRGVRDRQAHGAVDAGGAHRLQGTGDGAVAEAPDAFRRAAERSRGDLVRPDVDVRVDDHQSFELSPPSATKTEPVMKSDRGEARRQISGPISSGMPMRPAGILRNRRRRISSFSSTADWAAVS